MAIYVMLCIPSIYLLRKNIPKSRKLKNQGGKIIYSYLIPASGSLSSLSSFYTSSFILYFISSSIPTSTTTLILPPISLSLFYLFIFHSLHLFPSPSCSHPCLVSSSTLFHFLCLFFSLPFCHM